MDIDRFCKIANVETFDCGPGWGGRFGIREKGSNVSTCGYRTERAAKIAYIKDNCGVFGEAVVKILKANERKSKTKKVK